MQQKLNDILSGLDAVLITSAHNLRFFTGFAGGEGVGVIGDGYRCLFVDSRYTVEAEEEAAEFEVTEYEGGKLFETVASVLAAHGVRNIGFENTVMTVAEHEKWRNALGGAELVGLDDKPDILRVVKTDEELSLMRTAEHIGDMAFSEVLPLIKAGVSENDIAAELEYRMRQHGASGTSFETIVVSGAKSAMPHGKPDNKKLQRGDFVTMDFGCVYHGYCSDMTRTVVIESASEEKKKIYNTVLAAQLTGLDSIRAGIDCKTADAAARSVIESAGYGKCFGHALGHGVGLLIHEQPTLSPRSDMILCDNMVVTCEPGIYIEGVGGVRIEDMVIVKKDGIENLAASPKELIICG